MTAAKSTIWFMHIYLLIFFYAIFCNAQKFSVKSCSNSSAILESPHYKVNFKKESLLQAFAPINVCSLPSQSTISYNTHSNSHAQLHYTQTIVRVDLRRWVSHIIIVSFFCLGAVVKIMQPACTFFSILLAFYSQFSVDFFSFSVSFFFIFWKSLEVAVE